MIFPFFSFTGAANNLSGRRWTGFLPVYRASLGSRGIPYVRRPRPLFDQRLGGELMFSGAASIALCGPRVKMCQNSSSRSRRRPQKAVRRPYKLTARPGPASAQWWKGIVEKSCDATRYPPPSRLTCLRPLVVKLGTRDIAKILMYADELCGDWIRLYTDLVYPC